MFTPLNAWRQFNGVVLRQIHCNRGWRDLITWLFATPIADRKGYVALIFKFHGSRHVCLLPAYEPFRQLAKVHMAEIKQNRRSWAASNPINKVFNYPLTPLNMWLIFIKL